MLRLVVDHVSAGIANRSPHAPTVPARANCAVADRGSARDVEVVVPAFQRDGYDDNAAWSVHADILAARERGGSGPCAA